MPATLRLRSIPIADHIQDTSAGTIISAIEEDGLLATLAYNVARRGTAAKLPRDPGRPELAKPELRKWNAQHPEASCTEGIRTL